MSRFLSIWFRHLATDYLTLRRPDLRGQPFVLTIPDHGRKLIVAANAKAQAEGVDAGMVAADARSLIPRLEVLDHQPGLEDKLLRALALWSIRFTPVCTMDPADGLLLDITGCAHLWAGEGLYLKDLVTRLRVRGYDVRAAIADTVGGAWAVARYGKTTPIVPPAEQRAALASLSPAALRLPVDTLDLLTRLGLYRIAQLERIPRSALRRRFGPGLLLRMDQAYGREEEAIEPVQPIPEYQERLPCLEPIETAAGIEVALMRLLEALCARLQREGKGLRTAVFKGFRVDGRTVWIEIGTNRPSHHTQHLYKLFSEKVPTLEPEPGIELFVLEASKVEDAPSRQETLWHGATELGDPALAELLDRVAGKFGSRVIRRYLPSEHHQPERSFQQAETLQCPSATWTVPRPRPIHLLTKPSPIEVTAPIPDYPPMNFRYLDKLHVVKRADGPERIEAEWWLEDTLHRDYYTVEDEDGARYWLFRAGHYSGERPVEWFLHGFFA